ncbi:MAG TPA: phosphatidate cytidylyltransferase [Fimbriimonadaceae bacterium]|nr:phosphatidate cytidylyltransferase [Fimbriimonadaceae bacterium]
MREPRASRASPFGRQDRRRGLRQRVLTAALLIPPVLLAVFLSTSWPVGILGLAAQMICFWELAVMVSPDNAFIAPVTGLLDYILLTGIVLCQWLGMLRKPVDPSVWMPYLVAIGICGLLGAGAAILLARGRRGRFVTEMAGLWITAGFASLTVLKASFVSGNIVWDWSTPVLLALVPLWIGDTLAIFAGRAFGKHPLAPKISPKKTVEGGVANLLGCILGAVGLAYLIRQPVLVGILVGVATGILGQAGDLLESALKRSANVKDSGNLLPGHGGLLDRIDSILLSAPAVAIIVVSLGTHGG